MNAPTNPQIQDTLSCMKAVRRWLMWRYESDGDGKKPKKVPYYLSGLKRHGALDSQEDQAAFGSYEDAQKVAQTHPRQYAGYAFALGPDGSGLCWQGLDLDDILENDLAKLADDAPGYVELSPSENGIHAIGYGRRFETLGANASGVEAYSHGRFFTFTENKIRNAPIGCIAHFVEQRAAPLHSLPRRHNGAPSDATAVSVPYKTVTELRSALAHMRSDDRDLWVKMGYALKELGQTGRGLWLEWSQTSEKYDPKDAAHKWDSFNPTQTSYQAVFAEAQRQGWVNPMSSAAQIAGAASTSHRLPVPKGPIRILTEDDLFARPPIQWIVKRVIPDVGVGAIFGQSGTFKSFLTLDLLAHIANGMEWFGHRTRRVPATYIPFEGQGGIPKRVQAWVAGHERISITSVEPLNVSFHRTQTGIGFIDEPLNLREASDRDRLVDAMIASGRIGGVLCIDTLAHAAQGLDENSSQMGEMITIFGELQRRLGGVILVIHHSGKNQTAGMRGWSGLHAAMDFVVECQRPENACDHEAQFVLSKVKDEASGKPFSFEMKRVVLGYDDDDDLITSLQVLPSLNEPDFGGAGAGGSKKPKAKGIRDINSETSAADDDFLWNWVSKEVEAGNFPSKNSLKGQLAVMKETYDITQDRIPAAVDRMLAAGRLKDEPKSNTGNRWLRAVGMAPGADGGQV